MPLVDARVALVLARTSEMAASVGDVRARMSEKRARLESMPAVVDDPRPLFDAKDMPVARSPSRPRLARARAKSAGCALEDVFQPQGLQKQ